MNKNDIIEAFQKAKRIKIGCIICTLVTLLICTIFAGITGSVNWIYLYVIIIAASLFIIWKYWRCPKCDHALPREMGFEFCPYCGTRVQYKY